MTGHLEIHRADGIERRRLLATGERARVEGACPGCQVQPFLVVCRGSHRQDDRTLRGGAYCVACGDPVGWLYVHPDTLFGLEEDERVTNGRARVY